ncbi:MAG: UDP-N-acetylmuramoyl-L-alanyl-D-glutamate--2,6-diaminopimelate ligase [Planctomycetes bacterium]|nr:UDP-N-acetylmuramoyl-L-alanyl-D-glutamate--2,6-diaminopimelate ligase [Planctomycetota bacterium]
MGVGDLFFALQGTREAGTRYVRDARLRGASAVLAAGPVPAEDLGSLPLWQHPEPRRTAGLAARAVYGDPGHGMFVAAVTGTNGKTTTAHLAGQLLALGGRRCGVVGTAGIRLADGRLRPATHTTPDAPELQRLLAEHARLGGDALALEASSHALEQERLSGLRVDAAVFTNLTRDHLDYHGDLESYARAKQRLFEGLERGSKAVVNADDPASERMAKAARAAGAGVITYSARSQADLCVSRLETGLEGTHFDLHGMGISGARVHLPLPGRYNVENALAAVACALLSGASPATIVAGLATVSPAPGRLERIVAPHGGARVFVDYAHSEDALLNVCRTLRETLESEGAHALDFAIRGEQKKHEAHVKGRESATCSRGTDGAARTGRLIVVFGCGGDRDRGKRSPMGRVVNEYADIAIVTSDNPRSEDPERIISEVVAGMQPPRAERTVEVDRRSAIRRAIEVAREGDVVLIAGKGHENTQTIGSRVHEFDDREVAREALR